MARHYLPAATESGYVFDIPAPAIDLGTSTQNFGSTGVYVSGGAYTRRTQFGARTYSVSWNYLDDSDIQNLINLFNAGKFYWNSPLHYKNIAPPWMSYPLGAAPENIDFTEDYSLIRGYEPVVGESEDAPSLADVYTHTAEGKWLGYRYEFTDTLDTSSTRRFTFYVPQGLEAHVYLIGDNLQYLNILLDDVPVVWDSSVDATPVPDVVGPGVHTLQASPSAGDGDVATLVYTSISLVESGTPPEPTFTYNTPRGVSALNFTEEGLQIIQHSAALDKQSATATWNEVGWW